jgi:hypothetical protein
MKQNGRSMTKDQVAALGEQLRKAERAGDVGGAYRLLKLGTADDAALIALRAGHSTVSTNDRIFWEYLQRQIAKACRHLCDGFELRQLLTR